MKNSFLGYYPPTDTEFETLWKNATVILDANVLLDLYRYPTTAREELITVLESLKKRLWIPHQVALEFQKRRISVIANEQKRTGEIFNDTSEILANLKNKIESLQFEKRKLNIDHGELNASLAKTSDILQASIKAIQDSQIGISATDNIRDRIDAIFASSVGNGPTSQEELDGLIADGEDRYKEKIPPGFMDAEKDKSANEATFQFDKIKYIRKFGDLILWKQILRYAKQSEIRNVIFVTGDKKEDWIWREHGKTLGPHPELTREIRKESGVELFWIYSSPQFVENANKFLGTKISKESLEEITSLASLPENIQARSANTVTKNRFHNRIISFDNELPARKSKDAAVFEWISNKYEGCEIGKYVFPDYIAYPGGNEIHGFEIKHHNSVNIEDLSPSVSYAMAKGAKEIQSSRLTSFYLILVLHYSEFIKPESSRSLSALSNHMQNLINKYPIDGILIGAITDSTFTVYKTLSSRSLFDDSEAESP